MIYVYAHIYVCAYYLGSAPEAALALSLSLSLSLPVCVYVIYIYTYIHIYICMQIHTYTYVYIYIYKYVYIRTPKQDHTHKGLSRNILRLSNVGSPTSGVCISAVSLSSLVMSLGITNIVLLTIAIVVAFVPIEPDLLKLLLLQTLPVLMSVDNPEKAALAPCGLFVDALPS